MNEEVRLQKYLAQAGVCSRRAAETLITEGEVSVNGKPAEIGQKVIPGKDKVVCQGRGIKPQQDAPLTLLVNKPKGYLCTNADPHGGKTVFDLVPPPLNELRLFCAGRLDKNSEGLVVLTNDGDLANTILHPSASITKRYRVTVTKPFPISKRSQLLKGFEAEGEFLRAEKVVLLPPVKNEASTELEIHLHHGRKREIRRLLEGVGFLVKRLQRFQIGNLTKKGLPKGAVRVLDKKQINQLLSRTK
ncbi:MAG: rRNA pseudouridine synthase [Opitutales bacterium]|nr:rRNA pseudouridine synthase [Opitutales bacterium]MCH8539587.1 rRNA pseudouridine synthase [Opitutales bacterium]